MAPPAEAGTKDVHGEIPDSAIVALALSDPRAFGELFDRYWNDIFKFCYYRLGDWHRAEDVASQVFLEAIANLRSFDARNRHDSFRAWLYGIARNVTASARRTEQRHPTAPIEQATALIDRADSVEDQALAADELARLRVLLLELSPEQQELVELRLAGLTSLEIAHVLGKSHDAVRKAQSRTMAALKTAAAKTPGFPGEAHHG
jgi:RNA polymerase sigma-70 factor (ECF subfamily)